MRLLSAHNDKYMADYNIQVLGLKEFQAAIVRSPQLVARRVQEFLVRGMAVYRSGIKNDPWRIGMSGGGSPVAAIHGGNLRDSHQVTFETFNARIFPTAWYADYVHGWDGQAFSSRGLQLRPWMDYVYAQKYGEIKKLEETLLEDLVKDLV